MCEEGADGRGGKAGREGGEKGRREGDVLPCVRVRHYGGIVPGTRIYTEMVCDYSTLCVQSLSLHYEYNKEEVVPYSRGMDTRKLPICYKSKRGMERRSVVNLTPVVTFDGIDLTLARAEAGLFFLNPEAPSLLRFPIAVEGRRRGRPPFVKSGAALEGLCLFLCTADVLLLAELTRDLPTCLFLHSVSELEINDKRSAGWIGMASTLVEFVGFASR